MIFRKVKVIIKNENTLGAREIQKKLEEQRIRFSNSLVTKAFEKQENTITKTECKKILLNDVQKNQEKSFAKIILTQITLKWYLLANVFSKVENKEVENGVPIKKAIKSNQWSRNDR